MGCDIHAMIERRSYADWDSKQEHPRWKNAGDPELWRNYALFTALAGVRQNDDNQPIISEPRGVQDDWCRPFEAWYNEWKLDAHSTSFVTLAEIKNYHWDSPYPWWQEVWDHLVNALDRVKRFGDTDEDIRLVFFFDN